MEEHELIHENNELRSVITELQQRMTDAHDALQIISDLWINLEFKPESDDHRVVRKGILQALNRAQKKVLPDWYEAD